MLNPLFVDTQMNIIERLTELIPPSSARSSAIEYGAAPESNYGNTLFNFEINNWKVLCIHPDKECCDETRIYRRFVLNKDCSTGGNSTLDDAISRINVEEIKILLIKNTKDEEIPHVIKGLDLVGRKTQLVCIQENESTRGMVESYLKGKGFRFLERVLVSDIFVKDPELERVERNFSQIDNIFQV